MQAQCSAACLLVVVARHVLFHALARRLVLAGGASDHTAAHPTLQQQCASSQALPILWSKSDK